MVEAPGYIEEAIVLSTAICISDWYVVRSIVEILETDKEVWKKVEGFWKYSARRVKDNTYILEEPSVMVPVSEEEWVIVNVNGGAILSAINAR